MSFSSFQSFLDIKLVLQVCPRIPIFLPFNIKYYGRFLGIKECPTWLLTEPTELFKLGHVKILILGQSRFHYNLNNN